MKIFPIHIKPHHDSAVIRREYLGGQEDVTLQQFIDDVVQDEDLAIEIARQITDDPYDWNEEMDSEFYERFSILDADELRRQLDKKHAESNYLEVSR